jgi:hypothetical protein
MHTGHGYACSIQYSASQVSYASFTHTSFLVYCIELQNVVDVTTPYTGKNISVIVISDRASY